ncbi:MAG: hypothetical protein GXY94_03005 [Bacteroidales bacterium]|nr:hypothetical protein [Bacteroidales bacterium]
MAGRGFFGVGIMFSTADGLIGYMNGDNERLYVAIIDIVISTALYASGVGIVGIPVYYILKEVLTPSGHRSQPFNLQDLSKPYYQEPDNLRIEKPLLLR